MRKVFINLMFGVLIFICLTLFLLVLRYKEHDTYHRSKVKEQAFLVDLVKIYPIGTPMQTILTDLGMDIGCVQNYPAKEGSYLAITPNIYVEQNEIRDYSGFTFEFYKGLLVDIEPTGPSCPGKSMDLSRLIYQKKKASVSGILSKK